MPKAWELCEDLRKHDPEGGSYACFRRCDPAREAAGTTASGWTCTGAAPEWSETGCCG